MTWRPDHNESAAFAVKYRIPYGQAVDQSVKLRAAASAVLNLRADAASLDGGEAVEIAWDPIGDPKTVGDRPAQPIEIRAKPIALAGNLGANAQPLIRFRLKFGHGTGVWQEPIPETPGLLTAATEFSVPARGWFGRFSCRELKIAFRNAGNAARTGSLTNIQLLVTINPVGSVEREPYIYTEQRQNVVAPAVHHAFPIAAREWRLVNQFGLPLTDPAVVVGLYTMSGPLLAPAQPAPSFADWTPISPAANQWNILGAAAAVEGAMAVYR